jgi:hypothetical protein
MSLRVTGPNLLRRLLVAVAIAGVARPAAVYAEATPATVGARVRLTLADSARQAPLGPQAAALVGTLARASADTLYVVPAGTVTPAAIPRSAVRALFVSRGVSRRRSAVEQALIGGVTWALLTYATGGSEGAPARRVAAYGAAGVGVGAVLGAVRPYERWRRAGP